MKTGNKWWIPVTEKSWLMRLAWTYLFFFIFIALTVAFLPLSFAPNALDLEHIFQPPFKFSIYAPTQPFHWLGTDQLGRDVLVNMLYGARTALLISVPAMLLASILGIGLGAMAGYFGNKTLSINRANLFAFSVGLFLLIFYGFIIPDIAFPLTGENVFAVVCNKMALLITIVIISCLIYKSLVAFGFFKTNIYIPVDFLVIKLTEILQTVPRLLLILVLSAFFRTSLNTVIWLIVFTYWTSLARLVRAETLKISNLPYLEAAKALGFSDARIILKHILPNALPTILVAVTFGITSLMALESTLSFLSIGIPPDMPSWGRAITGIRANPEAWWLVFFPGLILSLTVLSLQVVCNNVIKQINPRRTDIINFIKD